jgi:hypothetical protein
LHFGPGSSYHDNWPTGDGGDSSADERGISLVCDLTDLDLSPAVKLEGDIPVRWTSLISWLV